MAKKVRVFDNGNSHKENEVNNVRREIDWTFEIEKELPDVFSYAPSNGEIHNDSNSENSNFGDPKQKNDFQTNLQDGLPSKAIYEAELEEKSKVLSSMPLESKSYDVILNSNKFPGLRFTADLEQDKIQGDFFAFEYVNLIILFNQWMYNTYRINDVIFSLPSPDILEKMHKSQILINEKNSFYISINRKKLELHYILDDLYSIYFRDESMRINERQFNELEAIELYSLIYNYSQTINEILSIDSLLTDPKIRLSLEIEKKLANYDRLDEVILRASGMTLEAVGNIFGVTRERIRQITEIYFRKMNPYLTYYLDLEFGKRNYHLVSEINNISSSKITKSFLKHYIKYSRKLKYVEEISAYIDEKSSEYISYYEFLGALESETEIDFSFIDEFLENRESLSTLFMDIDLIKFMKKRGFHFFHDKFIKLKLYKDFLLYLIKEYFTNGIELRQMSETEDYMKLLELCNDYFPQVDTDRTVRSVVARITEGLVSIDRSVYVHEDIFSSWSFDISFMEKSLNEIGKKEVYYNEVYHKYEDNLYNQGIDNWFFLRSVLRKYYEEEFEFNRDSFYRKGLKNPVSRDTRVYNYIEENFTFFTKNTIKDKFPGITDISIYGMVTNRYFYIEWGKEGNNSQYITINSFGKISSLPSLDDFVEREFGSFTYISMTKVFEKLRKMVSFDEYLVFTKLNLQKYFENLSRKYKVIDEGLINQNSQLDNLSLLERFMIYINNEKIFNYADFREFRLENKLSIGLVGSVTDILESQCVRLDEDKYLVEFEDNEFEQLTKSIEDEIESHRFNNSFIPFTEFIKNALPDIPYTYDLNEYFLISLLNKYSEKYTANYIQYNWFTIRGFISKYKNLSFSDSIFSYLEEVGLNEISEYELLKYLVDKDVLLNELPQEFYESKKAEYINGVFHLNK